MKNQSNSFTFGKCLFFYKENSSYTDAYALDFESQKAIFLSIVGQGYAAIHVKDFNESKSHIEEYNFVSTSGTHFDTLRSKAFSILKSI